MITGSVRMIILTMRQQNELSLKVIILLDGGLWLDVSHNSFLLTIETNKSEPC